MKLVTGLVYVNTSAHRFDDELQVVEEGLATLPLDRVRPPKSVLDAIMNSYREGSAPVGRGRRMSLRGARAVECGARPPDARRIREQG